MKPSNAYRNIFVIDDDKEMRELIRDVLSQRGYAVEVFGTGMSALSAMESGPKDGKSPADIVICDVVMPEMDGREFTKRLHVMRAAIPVILITGFGSALSHREALSAGASFLLTKPFGISELLDALKLVT